MQGIAARASVCGGQTALLTSGRREAKLNAPRGPGVSRSTERLRGMQGPCPGALLPYVGYALALAPEAPEAGRRGGDVPARGLAE